MGWSSGPAGKPMTSSNSRRWVSRLPGGLVAAALVAAMAGCGKEEPPEPGPGAVLKRYYSAAEDPEARCDTLSARSVARFGSRANCVERTIPSPDPPDEARVEAVRVRGDRACVRYELERGGKGIATLVREADGWKVDRFDSGLEASQPAALPCALEQEEEPE
jgi:hypothetical protein